MSFVIYFRRDMLQRKIIRVMFCTRYLFRDALSNAAWRGTYLIISSFYAKGLNDIFDAYNSIL